MIRLASLFHHRATSVVAASCRRQVFLLEKRQAQLARRNIFTTSTSSFSSSLLRHHSSAASVAAPLGDDSSDDDTAKKYNIALASNNNNNNNNKNMNSIATTTTTTTREEIRRLKHIRNVGIFAHVDAGKTTVTERMLALAGVIRAAGSVDDGNTVTDYLPAERERGITIQSAAVSFEWGWHNSRTGDDYDANDNVVIHLIDTPGHVDFSVEVNRSVAVLDGAVLVVDAVAGAQAQTETVWRAMTRPFTTHFLDTTTTTTTTAAPAIAAETSTLPQTVKSLLQQDHAHEPLPCLALINKCDKDGCHFGRAITSLRNKLQGANPIAIQLPLFRMSNTQRSRSSNSSSSNSSGVVEHSRLVGADIVAVPTNESMSVLGDFVGVVDLLHMRAIVWPDGDYTDVESCVPTVIPLLQVGTHSPLDPTCPVTQRALDGRADIIAALADVDTIIEEFFLNEDEPSNAELRLALRRATLAHKVLPVMAGAALKGKGVEPLIDAIADLLPSPLDRMPPALNKLEFAPPETKHSGGGGSSSRSSSHNKKKSNKKTSEHDSDVERSVAKSKIALGHPLHPSLIALAFKVVHMKGRGGSGDGRVVFARVYSGILHDREMVQVVTPPAPGEAPALPRTERVCGMLELSGGRFDNHEHGICRSGDVCALVGLKSVVTGDTIMMIPAGESSGGNSGQSKANAKNPKTSVCFAGVASPKPVLTVRLETESSEQQSRLTEALALLAVEDPSLLVEETPRGTLLSGLGELHIEVTLDRIYREFGLRIRQGAPVVTYRETINGVIDTEGLVRSERSVGGTKMQASLHVILETSVNEEESDSASSSFMISDPVVLLSEKVRKFLMVSDTHSTHDLMFESDLVHALVQGCQGALKRGPLGSHAMANVICHVVDIDSDGGLPALQAFPGSLRAAAVNTISTTLKEQKNTCVALEPSMSIEISVPDEMVGLILSDLTGRRGLVNEVVIGGGDNHKQTIVRGNALIRGEVPLVEIIGYANSLRSITAGQGSFTAEYSGYSKCCG